MAKNSAFGEYLQARRKLVRPDDVELRSYGRRRVPGLRREEVAGLAGISVDYHVRLEQGKDGERRQARSRSATVDSNRRRSPRSIGDSPARSRVLLPLTGAVTITNADHLKALQLLDMDIFVEAMTGVGQDVTDIDDYARADASGLPSAARLILGVAASGSVAAHPVRVADVGH